MQGSFRRWTATATAAIVMLAVGLVATAQQQTERRQRGARQETARQAGGEAIVTEQHLAACLIIDNQGEIELAEFAQQNAEGDEVKQFAQQMVQEHTEFVSKLQQFAGPAGAALAPRREVRGQTEEGEENPRSERREEGTERREDDADRREEGADRRESANEDEDRAEGQTERRQRTTSRRPAAEGQGVDLLTLKQELGQKCLQSTKEALSEKSGAEFDKAYITQQCLAHVQMIDTLEVFASHASPEFREVLNQGTETAKQHLEHCKELCKKIEGQTRE